MILYHFTTPIHLPAIMAEGVLRTTDSNLLKREGASPRVVWLLDTSFVGDKPDHGLHVAGFPDKRIIRVTVDVPDASRWLDWGKQRRHDPAWMRVMIHSGGGDKAARHWWVVNRPIPRHEWVEIVDMRTMTVQSKVVIGETDR